MEFIRRTDTWTLNQLYEYFLDKSKSTKFNEANSLTLNPFMDIASRNTWTASSEEADFDRKNRMIIDSMKCEAVSSPKFEISFYSTRINFHFNFPV